EIVAFTYICYYITILPESANRFMKFSTMILLCIANIWTKPCNIAPFSKKITLTLPFSYHPLI
ncbi:MAG: hypothetical protein KA938_03175, partial [Fervidobacterium sp.]|nr:hypothetical protein [Fervidobacterium sp.]